MAFVIASPSFPPFAGEEFGMVRVEVDRQGYNGSTFWLIRKSLGNDDEV